MASQEEGHQTPEQCPLCMNLSPRTNSAEPSSLDTVSPRTRLPLPNMTSFPACWDFCSRWPLGLSQAFSAVAPWVPRADRGQGHSLPVFESLWWGHGGTVPPVTGSIRFPTFLSIRTVSGALSTTGQRRKEQTRRAGLRYSTSETSAMGPHPAPPPTSPISQMALSRSETSP